MNDGKWHKNLEPLTTATASLFGLKDEPLPTYQQL